MLKPGLRCGAALGVAMFLVLLPRRGHEFLAAQTAGGLPALHGEGVTANIATGELVLFGGRSSDGPLDGTWTRARGGWSRRPGGWNAPAHRAGHAMGFDPGRGEVFLFGGMRSNPLTLFCDTWILRGAEWRVAAQSPCLGERQRNASLVYDTEAKTMVLVSGPAVGADEPRPLEIWMWDGGQWIVEDRSGPRRVGFGAVAYDEARHTLVVPVLFGGPDAGVWEWHARAWKRVTSEGPGIRQTYGLAYDSTRRAVVLAGGQGSTGGPYLDDVWTWDGDRWTRVQTTGSAGQRAGATLIDRRDGRLTYFGGYDESGPRAETWDLRGSIWQRVP